MFMVVIIFKWLCSVISKHATLLYQRFGFKPWCFLESLITCIVISFGYREVGYQSNCLWSQLLEVAPQNFHQLSMLKQPITITIKNYQSVSFAWNFRKKNFITWPTIWPILTIEFLKYLNNDLLALHLKTGWRHKILWSFSWPEMIE